MSNFQIVSAAAYALAALPFAGNVWEHAYYLDYQHRRAEHVAAALDKLINWASRPTTSDRPDTAATRTRCFED